MRPKPSNLHEVSWAPTLRSKIGVVHIVDSIDPVALCGARVGPFRYLPAMDADRCMSCTSKARERGAL